MVSCNLSPIDLVLFDSDGTLVDSEIIMARAWEQYLPAFGITITADDALTRFKGISMLDSVVYLEGVRGAAFPESFIPDFRAYLAVMLQNELQPISGALALVKSLTMPFCLASNGPREKIDLCLGVTGLLPYFEGRIFSAYEVGSWKPDPGLYLHAAKVMGVDPSRCAVVEDSLPGMHAGVAAGMTVFALQEDVPHPDIPEGVHVVRSLDELSVILAVRN
jgi:HAD superfamily hydrolase (TIGR01509 family)